MLSFYGIWGKKIRINNHHFSTQKVKHFAVPQNHRFAKGIVIEWYGTA